MKTRIVWACLAALLATLGSNAVIATDRDADAGSATVVYLARHAEPVYPPPEDAPKDPPLNEVGRARAERLAQVLQDAGITRILSSDFRRTRETAAPLAETLGLEVELYDPWKLEELATRLRESPGRVFVSGHSNTTPELVRLLGGDPGRPIKESTEFDRLYAVVLVPGRPAETLFLHYGERPLAEFPPRD